jgi:hypothetical protein
MSKFFAIPTMSLLVVMMMLSGCGEMRKALKPCDGEKYMTDKNYYRARFMSQSVMEEVALDKAKSGARKELATQISDHVQMVNDRFFEDYYQNTSEDLKLKFIELTRQIVDVVLYDSYIICEQPYEHKKENYFKYWVVVEMPKESYLLKLNQKVSLDDELQINFDMEEYQKTFNQYFGK